MKPLCVVSVCVLAALSACASLKPDGKAGPRPGDTKRLDLGRGVKVKLVWIPPGEFLMGSNNGDGDEKPVRRVKLTKGFWMGKYEVTQKQYEAVMGSDPSNFKGANLPVETVSWDDAVAFGRKAGVRLPTEAEWEYACRAGTNTKFHSGDRENDLARVAWYFSNSNGRTHPVGGKQANAFGLHDMHGNVWEWCADWYGNYPNNEETNPTGTASGQCRVLRGGSWYSEDYLSHSAVRGRYSPANSYYGFGFRVCLDFP
jgi:formylglycine-generating enzyme required for sulfatase activity